MMLDCLEQVRSCFGATTAPHRASNVSARPQTEDGMQHKLAGSDVCDALREQRQAHPRDKAGEVCFDPRLTESTVDNCNHDAVVRAITGED